MKQLTSFTAILFLLISFSARGQDAVPKGFVKGSIVLTDNSEISGYIKDEIRNKASVVMIAGTAGKKASYDGDKLNTVTIDGTRYICMKGDFFKLLCDGEWCFLQKSSDASSKPVYVGTETLFLNGTEGKPGDFFIFNRNLQQLKLVNSKNVAAVSAESFTNCEAAISKSKEAVNDIAMLKDAVLIYNNRNQ